MAFLPNITKAKPPKKSGGSKSQVFRNALYSYGKRAGTLKVLPGVKNTSVGMFMQNSRRRAYPIARALGTFSALQGGNLRAELIGRASRIATGSVSGRIIDQAVRPLGLPPFLARMARVQLGKQFSRETKFEKTIRETIQVSFNTKVKVNGREANRIVKKNPEIQREAQKLLSMIDVKLRAYAPDVSSGQYLIGVDGRQYGGGAKLLNESAMMSEEKFQQQGIKNYQGGAKYSYRDVFGFEKPGEARSYLLASIDRHNVVAARGDQDYFYYGGIDVGGSALFPWIHAVEYGGKLPFYKRTGREYKGGKRVQGYEEHLMDAYKLKNGLGTLKENKGAKAGQYVPDFKYIPPSMFIYRAASDALAAFKKQADFNYRGDIDKSSTYYYNQWLDIAKKKNGMDNFFKNETSYTRPSNTKDTLEALYRMDQDSSRKADFWSRMENKIPGPRVQMAHGNFYSQELASAIGLENVPEEFKFRFRVADITEDGGQPHSAKFLAELAKTYVETGGSKENVIKALDRKIQHSPHRGNLLRKTGMRPINTETNLKRFIAGGGSKKTKLGDVVYRDTAKSRREAERLYGFFRAQSAQIGNLGRKNQRSKDYIRSMYEFNVRREGKERVVYTRLKKGKSSNTSKAREADGQMYDKLAQSFLSTVELDEIYRQASNMDF